MRGISGSGKSSWIQKNLSDNVTICSADLFFSRNGEYQFDHTKLGKAHGSCKSSFLDALDRGDFEIVIDNTNTTRKEMEFYVKNARGYGYRVSFIRLNTDVSVAAKRNQHGVPLAAVQRMQDRMQPIPDHWGDEEVWGGV